MNPGFEIKEKLLRLEEALKQNNPRMEVLLREIHVHLFQDPECVTLLKEEEIAIVTQGLYRQTGLEIAVSGMKKPSVAKASLKNITVDDI